MNERSYIQAPEPERAPLWYDQFMPKSGATSSHRTLFDVTALRGVLFRQRWIIFGAIALALLVGLILTIIQHPVYQASTTLRVEPRGLYVVEGQDVAPQVFNNEISSYMSTQVSVIQSYNLALVVAENLRLDALSNLLGSDLSEGKSAETSNQEWLASQQTTAASILQGGVSADIPYNSRIATISFQSTDPMLAAEVANAYADAFVTSDARRSLESNAYAQSYLREQIAETRERLRDAEQAANAYARNNGIVAQASAAGDGASTTTTAASLAAISQTVATAKAARIAAEQRWRAVSEIPASQLPEVQRNAVIQGLQATKSQLIAERTDLRQRYNDNYPALAEVNARLIELERQIASTGADIKVGIRSEYLIAQRQEQALNNELRSVTSASLNEQDRRVQFGVLEREAEALRTQLAALLERFNSISTAANVQSGSITKLDPAQTPYSPVSPNLTRNLLIALVGGLALAGTLTVLRETFDDRLRSLDDIEERFGLPLLGHTPYVDRKGLSDHDSDQFDSLLESYASIRSTIDFAISREHNVLQITSSQPGEGKSTSALMLAELFAQLGRKTLLIDADLRKPSIAKLLGIEAPEVGLLEVLRGHAKVEEAITQGPVEHLDVLAVGSVPPNPVEALASQDMKKLLDDQRKAYSLILIDSSPIMGIADAPTLARHVDGTIFVLEANKVQFGQARSAIKRLKGVGANVFGIVLTKYRALTAGQNYDYQYRYYDKDGG